MAIKPPNYLSVFDTIFNYRLKKMQPKFLLAHISDLHLTVANRLAYDRINTRDPWLQMVEALNQFATKIDALLISGDLVQRGHEAVYEGLSGMLAALNMPVYIIIGNHDDRELLRSALPDHHYLPKSGKLHWCVDRWPLAMIGLDALQKGEGAGYLDSEQLEWLDKKLTSLINHPTILSVHQPPLTIGIDHVDEISLCEGKKDFVEILRKHRNIKRVLCGHVHRYCVGSLANTIVMTAPGCSHQLDLDFSNDAIPHYRLEPTGILLHAYFGEDVISHYQPLYMSKRAERQPFYSENT